MSRISALAAIPAGLRDPLIQEYREITKNYAEHRWSPSELSGGKFCEIVHTILAGQPPSSYAAKPAKPKDFPSACRTLESNTSVPHSFRILIPRMLPALYDVRNNRGVGHAGGDVDPNHMDATVVLSMCNWVMAELVRVFHNLPTTEEAQAVVDSLAERRIPLVWQNGDLKRVLVPKITLQDQILLLVASAPGSVAVADVLNWTDYKNKAYFRKLLKRLHDDRMIDLSNEGKQIQILPPGVKAVSDLIAARSVEV
jgi:hypothetical protein